MLYTFGQRVIYEPYLEADPEAAKGKSGSVWETLEEVTAYISTRPCMSTFNIYGVEASWEEDTKEVIGESWRALTRTAKLVRLD